MAIFAASVLLEIFVTAKLGRMGGGAIVKFVELYLGMVQMRALGYLYRFNKDRLEWFV